MRQIRSRSARQGRTRRGRAALAALLLPSALLAGCAGSSRTSTGPGDSTAASQAGAAAPDGAVTGTRWVVVARRQANERGQLSADALAERLAGAVRQSGGRIVGELSHLDAVVVAEVRDVEALRRHEAVRSVVAAPEHAAPPPPATPPEPGRPPGS